MPDRPQKITFGEMSSTGVRGLLIWLNSMCVRPAIFFEQFITREGGKQWQNPTVNWLRQPPGRHHDLADLSPRPAIERAGGLGTKSTLTAPR
jgi:hypothetical protein